MIQLQYYNSILKNNQINQILDNYKLKYSLVVKEIESKVNKMMKLFLEDILIFLENIEEVTNQKQKINEYDKNKRELDMMRIKLKTKSYNEHKLKNDIDLLLQENNILKLKVNSLNNKIFNLNNYYFYNSQYSSPLRKTLNNTKSKYSNSVPRRNNPSITPKSTRQNNLFIVLNNTSILKENIDNKHSYSLMSPKRNKKKLNKKDKSSQDNEHKAEIKKSEDKVNKKNKDSNQSKKRNKYVKFLNSKSINNNKNINANEDILIKSCDKINNSSHSPLNNNKNNLNRNDKNLNITIKSHISGDLESNSVNNKYSPLNQSSDIPSSNLNLDYDDIGKKINEAIDSELKELEQDEENIELLLGQLIDESENDNNN